MKLFVYCGAKSQGAYELVQALEGTRIRQFDGIDFWRKGKRVRLADDDVVICWGRSISEIDGIKILNSANDKSKAEQAALLSNSGIRTVQTMEVNKKPGEGWIPRLNSHIGGNDLLTPTDKPDFWVKKMNLTKEYRVHSFAERSIRAGVKVPREGFEVAPDEPTYWDNLGRYAHPWIRSYDAGWRIDYKDFQSTGNLRKLAHTSVKALGLTFGAVDIGLCDDGKEYVLEVNKAPGIEGGTLEAYVRAINRWVRGTKEEPEKVDKPIAPPTAAPDPWVAVAAPAGLRPEANWLRDYYAAPLANVVNADVVPVPVVVNGVPNNVEGYFRNLGLRREDEPIRPRPQWDWDRAIANLGEEDE